MPTLTTTTTPAPATIADNSTSTNATDPTNTTADPAGAAGGRKKRSLIPSDGTYTSETVAPTNFTAYKKLNLFEVGKLVISSFIRVAVI